MKKAVLVFLISLGITMASCTPEKQQAVDLKVQQKNEIENQSDKIDDKVLDKQESPPEKDSAELNVFQDSNGFFKFQYPKNLLMKAEKSDSGELNRIAFFVKENSSSRIIIEILGKKLDDAATNIKGDLEFTAQEQVTISGRVGLKLTLVSAVDKLVILPLDTSNSLRLEVRGGELSKAFEKILKTVIFLKS